MSSSFRVTVTNTSYPLFILATDVPKTTNVNVTERHIPGGNINYVDVGGLGLNHLVLDLLFKLPTDLLNFENAYGQVGTLTNYDGHIYKAIPTNPRRTAHGASAGGESVVQVDFLILARLT
jgi:hypothetical protein